MCAGGRYYHVFETRGFFVTLVPARTAFQYFGYDVCRKLHDPPKTKPTFSRHSVPVQHAYGRGHTNSYSRVRSKQQDGPISFAETSKMDVLGHGNIDATAKAVPLHFERR